LRSKTFRTFFFKAEVTIETDFLCHCENFLSSYVFIRWANFRYKPNAWNTKSRYYVQKWTTDTTQCAIWTSHSPPPSSLNPSVLLLFVISVLVFSACQIEILTRILLLLSVDDFSVEEDLPSFSIKKSRSHSSWKIQPNSTKTSWKALNILYRYKGVFF
jgi:hypothetical protein